MKTTTNKKGLRNPAVLAVASSPAGQKVISDTSETTRKLADTSISLIPFIVKTTIIVGGIYVAYRLYTDRFIKMGVNTSYPGANITDGQASARANAMYEAMKGIGANKDVVAMNLQGLNYNGWVKVYNAFGNRTGVIPFSKEMNLAEWLNDQFSGTDLLELKLILPGVF
ncbi:hypothetical protein AMR72_16320 [Flavobacterium psychrophilum]|nr:hypothetical protein AMR72_16320 [Flavobacterium psychrophilum]AOE53930.1 hypothetical protein ALW18_16310 [Flavobacterium psychrophilum]